MQHALADVDLGDDAHAVDPGETVGQLVRQVGALHAHADGEVLGGGIELVQVVLALVEVVAHFLVRHGDRARPRAGAAAVGEAVLGDGRQLRGGEAVAPVQVHHGLRERGMCVDDVGDLGDVHVDAEVAIHRHLA